MFQQLRKPGKEKEQLKQLRLDYRQLFSTESGKRVLTDLIENTGVFKTSFIPGKQIEMTFFRDGQRDIGLMVLDKLQIRDMDELQEFAET